MDKYLIINADDFGMCHAHNAATFDLLKKGAVTSATIMACCPWAYEAVRFAKENPQFAIGVHFTNTSEWQSYRWPPVTGAQSLKEYLDVHFRGTHITLLTGMMQDKQIEDCAKILAPLADLVVATQVDYERAAQAQDVADIFARYGAKATMSESSLPHALEQAREKTPADGITVCAGSLYVAGDVRNLLKCDNGCL